MPRPDDAAQNLTSVARNGSSSDDRRRHLAGRQYLADCRPVRRRVLALGISGAGILTVWVVVCGQPGFSYARRICHRGLD